MSRLRNTMKPMSFSFSGLLPMVLAFVAAIIMLLPIGTSVDSNYMPNLAIVSVFYWALYRPLQMPSGGAVLIGFFLDLWLDVPLGLNALLMVLVRVFILSQLRYLRGRSTFVHWFIFGGLVFALYGIAWVITSIISGVFIPLEPIIKQILMTIIAFPVVAFIFHQIRKKME